MNKVLFDARWVLVEDRFDGISRYSHELAHAMAARSDVKLVWLIHDKRQLEKLPSGDYLLANNPNNVWAEIFQLARTINRSGYKYVYSPFFVMGTLGKRYKLVLTTHDMIYFTHRTPPQWLPWYVRLGWRLSHLTYWPLRWQLNQANIVATVSDTARQELLEAHATKREIITVANAVSDNFRPAKPSTKLGQNIVYMGAFTPYKNVECVIDAVALVPGVTLHLCSKLPALRRDSLVKYIESKGITDRTVIHNGVPDQQYLELLATARCSISASLSEGFGLPLIEAQKAGVPFVAADTPIFHEIGASSVLYFDPNNPEQAAQHIRSLAQHDLRADYIVRGHRNAARYTWQNSAKVASNICKRLQS